jgi:uncharacterized membrane protein
MRTLLSYFGRGCLVLGPVAITLYIAIGFITIVDSWLPIGIPGLGFVLTIVLITLAGFLTSNVIGKAVVNEGERILARVPLIKLLYTSIRDLINAFVGDKKRFDRPVVVSVLPGSTAKALGFVTRESLTHLDMRGHVAVYFPQSYNFAGNVLLVPREHVETIDAASSDVMAFIVSGGVSGLGIGQHGESIPPSRGAPAAAQGSGKTLILEQPPKK